MKERLCMLLLAGVLFGCDTEQQDQRDGQVQPELTLPEARVGRVIEVIDVESYTYMSLDVNGQETWVATASLEVKPDDYVEFAGDMLMQDFHSKELDRTFDRVLFVSGLQVIEPGIAEQTKVDSRNSVNAGEASDEPLAASSVPLEGGLTVADIFARHGEKQGEAIKFRGRVDKVSMGILKRNWVTVSDGTGTAPENKVVITTQQVPEVGGIYVIEGALLFDQYIGPGYTYKVLVTDAVFSE